MTPQSEKYLPQGLPTPVPDDHGLMTPYLDGLEQDRLLVQRCPACLQWQWGPEWICHRCHHTTMDYVQVVPQGILYSWERVWHPVHPALKDRGPYLVGLVELPDAGNVRVVGNLLGDPMRMPRIGEPVRGVFEHSVDAADRRFSLLHWQAEDL